MEMGGEAWHAGANPGLYTVICFARDLRNPVFACDFKSRNSNYYISSISQQIALKPGI